MEKAVQLPAMEEASGPSGAKAHTLPAPSSSTALPEPSSAKKDKEKKFSRFAKKKWKERGVEKSQSELFITRFFKIHIYIYYFARINTSIVV